MIKQNLYYVVNIEIEDLGNESITTTGNKDIFLYEIKNNRPSLLKEFSVGVEEVSEDVIYEYLGEIMPEMEMYYIKKDYHLTEL